MITAIERQATQSADQATQDQPSPGKNTIAAKDLVLSGSGGSQDNSAETATRKHESATVMDKRTPSSSSLVTTISSPNASLAWETIEVEGKVGSVREKLSEFEAIIANINLHVSSPRQN